MSASMNLVHGSSMAVVVINKTECVKSWLGVKGVVCMI